MLYGLVSVGLAALAAVEVVVPSGALRTVLECGLTLGAFAGMALWIRLNRVALDQQASCDCARVTIRVIPGRHPEPPGLAPAGPVIPSPAYAGRAVEEEAWAVNSGQR